MFYSEEIVEEIRSKTDIVDVVSSRVKLQRKGDRFWGCCPFHNEKTPSFSVSGSRQMYHCFGCGAGGNVFTFLMKYENYSFPEAVRVLAERSGVDLPEAEYSEEQRQRANRRERLLAVNKEAAKFFYYQLRSPHGKTGHDYLEKRQLSEETMHRFGLGYAPKDGGELIRYLRKQGFDDELIRDAGLATHSEKRGMSALFWNRVMYPIQDGNHRVIGFGGRVMGEGEPKYLNSPETQIFDKRRNLYGLNFARTARSGNIIICEGYMDVIAMHQAGFTQAVASLGTAFTQEQAMLIKRFTDNVLLAYDSDGAGVKAALRNIGILREVGLSARVINMKPYKDPDEFIKNLGREAFEERIAQAENSFFFEIRILSGQYNQEDPEEKTKFHREIAKKLCTFTEDAERDNYLQAVAEKYFIGIENLRKLVLGAASRTGNAEPAQRPKSTGPRRPDREDAAKRNQRLLITWLTEVPALYPQIKPYISAEDFTDELYRRVTERMFAELDRGDFQPAAIISMFDDEEEQRQASELFQTRLPEIAGKREREKAFREILFAVKQNSYEFYAGKLGSDVNALSRVVEGKKALQALARLPITIAD